MPGKKTNAESEVAIERLNLSDERPSLSGAFDEPREIGLRGFLDPHALSDDQFQSSLRPSWMAEYIGQRKVCENLQIAISAAKRRGVAEEFTTKTQRPHEGPQRE